MPLDLETAGALLHGKRWHKALAADLGVSREAVRLWLAGAHPVPKEIAARLRELLGERRREIERALR